jgi:uncharacterized protein YqeY
MAIVLEGGLETLKALRKFTPDLYKEMNAEIRSAMSEVVSNAKTRVPQSIVGLSQWSESNKYAGQQNFPKYNGAIIRRGLQYSTKSSRPNKSGFVVLYSLVNKTAAGAIMETAGTQNPQGQPWVGSRVDKAFNNRKQSHSANPNAGAHFIKSLNQEIGSLKRVGSAERNKRGRIMYAALEAQQGRTNDKVMAAINKAVKKFNSITQRSYGTAA